MGLRAALSAFRLILSSKSTLLTPVGGMIIWGMGHSAKIRLGFGGTSMGPAVLLGLGLVSAIAADPSPPAPDLAAYGAAEAKVGRDPASHVKLALWCEAHGLPAERMKHLAIAVLSDPKQVTARGLLGLVDFAGKWQRPDAVSEKIQADEALTAALAEYNARRARTAETADAQWKLALWCEQHGLKAEAVAHLTAVTRHDPGREAAWKRLGYKRHGRRWVTDAQFASEKADAEAQKKADKTWKPLLTKWRGWLGETRRRGDAEAALDGVNDPRAVPSVWAVFGRGNDAQQALAVQMLGRIDAPDATRALALLSVYSGSAEVRRAATETLKSRDLRDIVGWLIALLRPPLKYEVRPVGGPGSPGVLFVENERFNLQRFYAPPRLPNIPIFPGEPITFDAAGLPVVTRFLGGGVFEERNDHFDGQVRVSHDQYVGRAPSDPARARMIDEAHSNRRLNVLDYGRFNRGVVISQTTSTDFRTPEESTVQIPVGQIMLQYQTAAAVAQQQLADDLQAVTRFNADVDASNERVGQVLRGLTGHDLGADREGWTAWWTDQQGYAYKPPQAEPKPTVVQNVPLAYTPPGVALHPQIDQTGPTTVSTSTMVSAATLGPPHSCFKAGTPVRTLLGPRPIETIRAGDRVLTQDAGTGSLSYQPVIAVYHNSPALTYAIRLGGETVSATGIHRFWKAGKGWVMARDLKPGDRIRTINGTAEVALVDPESVVPVFNLEVGHGQSFFVGNRGLLVHDNSLVQPVHEPFDAEPELNTVVSPGR